MPENSWRDASLDDRIDALRQYIVYLRQLLEEFFVVSANRDNAAAKRFRALEEELRRVLALLSLQTTDQKAPLLQKEEPSI